MATYLRCHGDTSRAVRINLYSNVDIKVFHCLKVKMYLIPSFIYGRDREVRYGGKVREEMGKRSLRLKQGSLSYNLSGNSNSRWRNIVFLQGIRGADFFLPYCS